MWWFIAGLLILLISCSIFAVFSIRSGIFVKGICSSPGTSYLLTFDDGPHTIYTPQILDILKKNNQKAIFFCIGKNVKSHPEIARRITQEGHEIGNHTYNHEVKSTFTDAKTYLEEIKNTSEIIESVTGQKCRYFRPPFGITNPSIAKAIKWSGLEMMAWNLRTFDTMAKKPETVLKKLKSRVKPDSLVLMHDTNPHTVEALQKFLS